MGSRLDADENVEQETILATLQRLKTRSPWGPSSTPIHSRIATKPVGVVHVLVSGDTPEHRLSQHSDQIMPTVPACASVSQTLLGDDRQAERIIELAIGKQPCIRCDTGTVKLQLEAAVEIEPCPADKRALQTQPG